jgi:hypothetical protein
MPYQIIEERLDTNKTDYIRDEQYRIRRFPTYGAALDYVMDQCDDKHIHTVIYKGEAKVRKR